ncbi:zinc-ribbon domain-containing protein [Candidatus Woesearchaeota archaeon]|nr:zinc-ribbon domain-containing protein [Candidatus Woesearchaeota archaeon]
MPKECLMCGTSLEAEDTYCPECGVDLEETESSG